LQLLFIFVSLWMRYETWCQYCGENFILEFRSQNYLYIYIYFYDVAKVNF